MVKLRVALLIVHPKSLDDPFSLFGIALCQLNTTLDADYLRMGQCVIVQKRHCRVPNPATKVWETNLALAGLSGAYGCRPPPNVVIDVM